MAWNRFRVTAAATPAVYLLHSLNLAHIYRCRASGQVHVLIQPIFFITRPISTGFLCGHHRKTPFRFHLDAGGAGHQDYFRTDWFGKIHLFRIFNGKFLRYPNAQIFVFDKDFSRLALTAALNGHHYNPGERGSPGFCPLMDLNSESAKNARQSIY